MNPYSRTLKQNQKFFDICSSGMRSVKLHTWLLPLVKVLRWSICSTSCKQTVHVILHHWCSVAVWQLSLMRKMIFQSKNTGCLEDWKIHIHVFPKGVQPMMFWSLFQILYYYYYAAGDWWEWRVLHQVCVQFPRNRSTISMRYSVLPTCIWSKCPCLRHQ